MVRLSSKAVATSCGSRSQHLHTLWAVIEGHPESRASDPLPQACQQFRQHVKPGEFLLLVPTECAKGGFPADLGYRIVKAGVPSGALDHFAAYFCINRLKTAEFLGLDRSTISRKIAGRHALPAHAAETMLRLLELDQLARDTFETDEEAATWLTKPHPMLGGESPMELAKSSYGAQLVKDILFAIRFGGVA